MTLAGANCTAIAHVVPGPTIGAETGIQLARESSLYPGFQAPLRGLGTTIAFVFSAGWLNITANQLAL